MEATEDYAQRTQRIKDLLSSYYGNDAEDSGSKGVGASRGDAPHSPQRNAVHGASAMDLPVFNADRHVKQMLKSSSLEKLLKEHRNMVREIKNLDSDMQQLVYENYNKFIAATDTIRTMKANVEGMGTNMEELKRIMDIVTDRSNSVSQKLATRRDKVEDLNRVQALLKKLQIVFDLPKKMKVALEVDALDTAVSYYSDALPLLKKYGHRGAFRGVVADSDVLAKEVGQILKKRLAERKDDTEQLVLLLRKLGEADDTLQERYLQGRSQRMKKILKEAHDIVDLLAARYSGSSDVEELSAKVAQYSWGWAPNGPSNIQEFISVFNEKTLTALKETSLNVTTIFLQEDSKLAAKRKPLVNMTKDIVNEHFNIVRRALADASCLAANRATCSEEALKDSSFSTDSPSLDFPADWGADEVADCAAQMVRDWSGLHALLPELAFRDRLAELTEKATRQHVTMCFAALERRVVRAIEDLRAQFAALPQDQAPLSLLPAAYQYCVDIAQRGLPALLQGVKFYENHPEVLGDGHDVFVDVVQGQLQNWFLALLANFMEAAKTKAESVDISRDQAGGAASAQAFSITSEQLLVACKQPLLGAAAISRSGSQQGGKDTSRTLGGDLPRTGIVLLLAKLCQFLEHTAVPMVMEAIANLFVGRGGAGDEPAFVGGDTARKLGKGCHLLLSTFVELHGRQLSLMVRRSVAATNWLHHKEPRAPRPICDLIIEKISKTEQEVSLLVEGQKEKLRHPDRSGRVIDHHRGGSQSADLDPSLALESTNVERHVAKLFQGKVKAFGQVKFARHHILGAVISVGLKSLVECIRLQTLGRAGLQQLQLDVQYLRPLLRRYVDGQSSTVVTFLLDEVVAAAVERSEDPSLLEPAVLDAILQSSRDEQ